MSLQNHTYMDLALEVAKRSVARGEVPVGAVIVQNNQLVVRAGNRVEGDKDPTAHAEILAIRAASKMLDSTHLVDCDLYVTLEPCTMCAAAISFARIRNLYFGAYDTKGGGIESGVHFFGQKTCFHAPEVFGGINEIQCGRIIQKFFHMLRN